MKLDPNTPIKALGPLYDKVLDGVSGFLSVEEMANDYLKGPGTLEERIDRLIRYQIAKASTSGFLAGLGGVLTLPIAIPANLSSIVRPASHDCCYRVHGRSWY